MAIIATLTATAHGMPFAQPEAVPIATATATPRAIANPMFMFTQLGPQEPLRPSWQLPERLSWLGMYEGS